MLVPSVHWRPAPAGVGSVLPNSISKQTFSNVCGLHMRPSGGTLYFHSLADCDLLKSFTLMSQKEKKKKSEWIVSASGGLLQSPHVLKIPPSQQLVLQKNTFMMWLQRETSAYIVSGTCTGADPDMKHLQKSKWIRPTYRQVITRTTGCTFLFLGNSYRCPVGITCRLMA
jgi:hypothetical protein